MCFPCVLAMKGSATQPHSDQTTKPPPAAPLCNIKERQVLEYHDPDWTYDTTVKVWLRTFKEANGKRRVQYAVGSTLDVGPSMTFNCTSIGPRLVRGKISDAEKWCRIATIYLESHRQKHGCYCDFAVFGNRRRIPRHDADQWPINHLMLPEKKQCSFFSIRGIVVRWAMFRHDCVCSCDCFGGKFGIFRWTTTPIETSKTEESRVEAP